jgi:hypothetical protein
MNLLMLWRAKIRLILTSLLFSFTRRPVQNAGHWMRWINAAGKKDWQKSELGKNGFVPRLRSRHS